MPSFTENGREDHIQNFAISFDQTRQGKIFLVEPHAMPYKSRFACCSVCCSCSTSLLLGYVDVSFVFKLVCPRTKQKRENRIYHYVQQQHILQRGRKGGLGHQRKHFSFVEFDFFKIQQFFGPVWFIICTTIKQRQQWAFICSTVAIDQKQLRTLCYRCMCSQLHESMTPIYVRVPNVYMYLLKYPYNNYKFFQRRKRANARQLYIQDIKFQHRKLCGLVCSVRGGALVTWI